MKKIWLILWFLLLVSFAAYQFVIYEKQKLEEAVVEHVIEEKNITKDEIVLYSAFISNLPGERNFMVSVQLNDDPRTYFYVRGRENKIYLESYTDENRVEHLGDYYNEDRK